MQECKVHCNDYDKFVVLQGLAPPTMPSAQSTLSVRIETPRASEGMAGTRVPVGGVCGRQSRPGGGRGPGGGEDKEAPLRLEDILDMCADYQRQMEAEQQEALRLREQASLQEVSGVSWGHPHQYLSTWPLPPVTSSNAVINSSFATVGDFNANDADDRYTSATATAAATTAASAAVPAFTGNHGQSTLVGQQWSPTSLAQKRSDIKEGTASSRICLILFQEYRKNYGVSFIH